MRQRMGNVGGFSFPKAGQGVIRLVILHVVAYVLYLVALRVGVDFARDELALVPRDVLLRGRIWQPVTSVLIHAPTDVGHLLFNMLMLWWFGGPLESWWGTRGLYKAYAASALGGVLLTILAGVAVLPLGPESSLYHLWTGAHLGASGAVLGVTICWGAAQWEQRLNFMFLGEMKVKTFVLILVGIQVLTALSFDGTSSTSHFGGIAAGWLYGRGWLKPARIRNWLTHRRVQAHQAERAKQRARFEVIQGGKDDEVGKPLWGGRRRDDEDDPVVH
ncbi:rhomboid family intramembrane serine protease, partial [Myxococcota bacterium]|nr:rhomboid family intramembrane serine protease [Myxococcota bacterium]